LFSFISLANVAQDLHLIQPKILPKELCVINIVNGRHILQEQYVDVFVPNSYHSSKESQKIKIITGLNSSGKSIYLKQVQSMFSCKKTTFNDYYYYYL